jgi:sec-independent protein translocase protein TatA
MGIPGGWELVAIVVVVLVLFGGKKIPELAKGIGKGIKDFKHAVKEDEKEGQKEEAKELASSDAKETPATSETKKENV